MTFKARGGVNAIFLGYRVLDSTNYMIKWQCILFFVPMKKYLGKWMIFCVILHKCAIILWKATLPRLLSWFSELSRYVASQKTLIAFAPSLVPKKCPAHRLYLIWYQMTKLNALNRFPRYCLLSSTISFRWWRLAIWQIYITA